MLVGCMDEPVGCMIRCSQTQTQEKALISPQTKGFLSEPLFFSHMEILLVSPSVYKSNRKNIHSWLLQCCYNPKVCVQLGL